MISSIDQTLFLGKEIIHLAACGSTNDELNQLLQNKNLPEGAIVITSAQTAGKGQRGNTWETAPGKNLTFSIYLRPAFITVVRQFDLNVCISLGILDYLKPFSRSFQVKWPNDIYHSEKKICGILIQNYINKQQIDRAVVGIGLNINQPSFNNEKPTSLTKITGEIYDLNKELQQLMAHIEARYISLKAGQAEKLREDYLDNLYWFGEDHIFRKDNENAFIGRIIGITEEGKLQIETKNGLKPFGMKEVEFVE